MEQFSDSDSANDGAIGFLLEMGQGFLKCNKQIKSSNENYDRAIQEGIDKMQNIVSQAQFIFTEEGQKEFNKSFGIENAENGKFFDFIVAVRKFFSCQSISRATKIELRDVLSGKEKDDHKDLTKVERFEDSIKSKIEDLEKIEPEELVRPEFPLNVSRNKSAVKNLENLILTKLGLTRGNF